MMKAIRINKGFELLDHRAVANIMKEKQKRRILRYIRRRENDPSRDITKISSMVLLTQILKTARLFMVIICLSYFVGMFWYMISHISMFGGKFSFIEDYALEAKENTEVMVALTYYAFTTFSTVGLGDYHPINSFERMFAALIMLFGVMITSYLVESFSQMVQQLHDFNKDHEESQKLNMFLGTLKKYNEGKNLSERFLTTIEDYFKYKWKKDKYLFLTSSLD